MKVCLKNDFTRLPSLAVGWDGLIPSYPKTATGCRFQFAVAESI